MNQTHRDSETAFGHRHGASVLALVLLLGAMGCSTDPADPAAGSGGAGATAASQGPTEGGTLGKGSPGDIADSDQATGGAEAGEPTTTLNLTVRVDIPDPPLGCALQTANSGAPSGETAGSGGSGGDLVSARLVGVGGSAAVVLPRDYEAAGSLGGSASSGSPKPSVSMTGGHDPSQIPAICRGLPCYASPRPARGTCDTDGNYAPCGGLPCGERCVNCDPERVDCLWNLYGESRCNSSGQCVPEADAACTP